jgi:hypothetical protein
MALPCSKEMTWSCLSAVVPTASEKGSSLKRKKVADVPPTALKRKKVTGELICIIQLFHYFCALQKKSSGMKRKRKPSIVNFRASPSLQQKAPALKLFGRSRPSVGVPGNS